MKVSYKGFTGELVRLEKGQFTCYGHAVYDLDIYDTEKGVAVSITGVKLEDVKFFDGAVSFGG